MTNEKKAGQQVLPDMGIFLMSTDTLSADVAEFRTKTTRNRRKRQTQLLARRRETSGEINEVTSAQGLTIFLAAGGGKLSLATSPSA